MFALLQVAILTLPLYFAALAFNDIPRSAASAGTEQLLFAAAFCILVQTIVATHAGRRIVRWEETPQDILFPILKACAIIELFFLLQQSAEIPLSDWPIVLSLFAGLTIGHLLHVKHRGRAQCPEYAQWLNQDIFFLFVILLGGVVWHLGWADLAGSGWQNLPPILVILATLKALWRHAIGTRQFIVEDGARPSRLAPSG